MNILLKLIQTINERDLKISLDSHVSIFVLIAKVYSSFYENLIF